MEMRRTRRLKGGHRGLGCDIQSCEDISEETPFKFFTKVFTEHKTFNPLINDQLGINQQKIKCQKISFDLK